MAWKMESAYAAEKRVHEVLSLYPVCRQGTDTSGRSDAIADPRIYHSLAIAVKKSAVEDRKSNRVPLPEELFRVPTLAFSVSGISFLSSNERSLLFTSLSVTHLSINYWIE